MKISKFDDAFSEPMSMSNDSYVLSGSFTREEAAKCFSDYIDYHVRPEALEVDRVRFGFPPANVADGEDLGACWYTGAKGKGTKEVWVLG
jgi:hypothetical protein